MSYKTIVVHCDANEKVGARLAVATELAERFHSTLVAVHARPPLELPSFDVTIASQPLYDAYERQADADQKNAREAFEDATKGKHVSTEWRVVDGFTDEVMATNARYADLVVVGQAYAEEFGPAPDDLPESIALSSGRPVLVVPYTGAPTRPGKTVMLCWNASRESALAATEALPFLKAADRVIVLIVDPHKSPNGHGPEPGADVATWLARHGIKATVHREVAMDTAVGEVILSRAADLGVDLIVMGVYGHSRMREFVLGGASRTLLNSMTVPVLMVH
ncbi:MAG TPA: universal stress protein [Reyranella sp.]|nr:universal stress protein [Reyranella sp.]